MIIRLLVFSLLSIVSGYLTAEEAAHTGLPAPERRIVEEFRRWTLSAAPHGVVEKGLKINEFSVHHAIVQMFCSQRDVRKKQLKKQKKQKKQKSLQCTWREYYELMDHIRKPYAKVYDPGLDPVGIPLSDFKFKRGSSKCPSLSVEKLTSSKFMSRVRQSKPFVVRGYASEWPQLRSWTLANLSATIGSAQVVASVSATGDFDGPEPSRWWPYDHDDDEELLIARPGHVSFPFREFLRLLKTHELRNATYQQQRHRHSHDDDDDDGLSSISAYLEYFPLHVLNAKAQGDLPDLTWARFLSLRYNLIWVGGASKTVGRLHFDRNENVMIMIAGQKVFTLYDPAQSATLYGDFPIRSASYEADYDAARASVKLRRSPSKVTGELVQAHTYSPVDIRHPDFNLFPKFKNARNITCRMKPVSFYGLCMMMMMILMININERTSL